MTEHEFERRLRTWYRDQVEAAGPMPPNLRAAVWSIPDEEPVRPAAVASWRRLLVLAAAAMLLALLVGGAIAIGLQLLPWERDEIDLQPEPDQPISWHLQQDTVMPAGTYYVDLATGGGRSGSALIRVSFTLPADWERVTIEGLLWGQTKWVLLAVPVNLYVDTCGPEPVLRDPPVGPSAADLAAALGEVRGWQIHEVTDVTVDGYLGKRVSMTAPGGTDCADSLLLRTVAWPGFAQGMREREAVTLWILDVEDERLVIWAGSENVTVAQTRELFDVVDSIEIAYLAAVPPGTGRGEDP
jgi:hypothetical protein